MKVYFCSRQILVNRKMEMEQSLEANNIVNWFS